MADVTEMFGQGPETPEDRELRELNTEVDRKGRMLGLAGVQVPIPTLFPEARSVALAQLLIELELIPQARLEVLFKKSLLELMEHLLAVAKQQQVQPNGGNGPRTKPTLIKPPGM